MTATASAPASAQIKNKALYRGTVKEQAVVWMGKADAQFPALMLTVAIDGELVDPYKPERGVQAGSYQGDADVFVKFDDSNSQSMDISLGDLERLGFEGDDLEELNPANGKHQSFVGKVVHLQVNKSVRNDQERVYWNLRFPKSFENTKLQKGELSKTSGGQAFRELLAQRRAAASGNPF